MTPRQIAKFLLLARREDLAREVLAIPETQSKITLPARPGKIKFFFNNMAKQLLNYAKEFDNLYLVDKEDVIQHVSREFDIADIEQAVDKAVSRTKTTAKEIQNITDVDFGISKVSSMVEKDLQHLLDDLVLLKRIVSRIDTFSKEDLEEFDYNIKYDNFDQKTKDALLAIPKLYYDFVSDLETFIKRTQETAKTSMYLFDDSKQQPEVEEIETLYHASVSARQIAKDGFSTPNQNSGLGGQDPRISFTSDLYIAKEIARSFKEAVLIAKGDLKSPQLLDWIEKDHLKDKVLPGYKGIANKDYDLSTPVGTFLLYRVYLTFLESAGGRYNPLYMTNEIELMNNLKTKNIHNVGIVVASVNMKHPDIKYIHAEREYRVPPAAVIQIEKVI